MKMKAKLAAVVIGSMAILNVEAAISAPMASAAAAFDWDTFSVTAYPIGPVLAAPVITWSNQSSSVSVQTDTDNQNGSADDWTTALVKHVGNPGTFSDAKADTSVLHSYSEDPDLSLASQASSSAYRQGDFSVAGSGFLVFSINYTLDSSLEPGNDYSNDYNSYANASVYLQMQKITSNVNNQYFTVGDSVYLYQDNLTNSPSKGPHKIRHSGAYPYQDNFTNSPAHSEGALNLAFLVNDGESYHFSVSNSSSVNVSSIPLPSAVWLFMSALLGVLSLTRRK